MGGAYTPRAPIVSQEVTVEPSVYVLPAATTSVLGGIVIGNGLDIDGSAIVTVDLSELLHNDLGTKQGGTSAEYYHLTSAEYTGSGTGVFARVAAPTFTTPTLGVASATSVNKVVITAPATGSTITIADGSTLATSGANSITLTSTGATNVTLPTSGTLATTAYADALVVGLIDDRGSYDASSNVFPSTGGSGSAGAILKGDLWYISVAGSLGGSAVNIGDSVRALVDTPGSTAANWSILESNIGFVPANVAVGLQQFASTTSLQLKTLISDETGSGALVFADSPTLITPALGTPASGVATNLTGTAASLTAGNVTTNANLTGHITSVGNAAVLGSFTSAQLLTALSDETGTDKAVFNTSPTFITSVLTSSTSFTAFAGATTLLTIGGTGASASLFAPSTLDATSSITGAIRTSGGISAAKALYVGTTLNVGGAVTFQGTGDRVVIIKADSSGGGADDDASLSLDASGTGEAELVFKIDGTQIGVLRTDGARRYLRLDNTLTDSVLFLGDELSESVVPHSLTWYRETGVAVISGVTGTITSTATVSTITGLSTVAGFQIGMLVTRTAGAGALGTNAVIRSIDSGTQITVAGFSTQTAGAITFDVTPNPSTIVAHSAGSSSGWTAGTTFARFGFANDDTSGAGDGGLKATLEGFVEDTGGTSAGVKIKVAASGTTLLDAVTFNSNLNASFAGNIGVGTSTYGSSAAKTLVLPNSATAPSASVDMAHLYSKDGNGAGTACLALYQEYAPAAGVAVASTHKIYMAINGTTYALLATTVL